MKLQQELIVQGKRHRKATRRGESETEDFEPPILKQTKKSDLQLEQKSTMPSQQTP